MHPRSRKANWLWIRCASCIALAALGVVALATCCAAADDESIQPLYERDAFDRITLKDKSVIEVQPLDFPDRKVPTNTKPTDKLMVRLLDNLDDSYELRWREIVEIKLFEQLLLDEGQRLTAEKKFDDAFAYFDYLDRNYPKFPGVPEALQAHLFADATAWHARQKYDYALALLNELASRNAGYSGLDRAMGAASDKLIEAAVARNDLRAARQVLTALAARYPQEQTVIRWQTELRSRAEKLLSEAQAETKASHIRVAQENARQALAFWPPLKPARQLAIELHERYAVVTVGVAQPAVRFGADRLDDWAARRAGRLTARTLVEFTGLGAEGGEYRSAFGEFEIAELGLQLSFRLRTDLTWPASGNPVTGYDVSRTVLALADSRDPRFEPGWADLFARVAVHDVYGADITLRRLHVRPAAFLQVPLAPTSGGGASDAAQEALGPYRAGKRSPQEAQFVFNEGYFSGAPRMPREIIERPFAKSSLMIEAFERGEISICERLSPWEVAKVRELPNTVVANYAVPTLHCLLPNNKKPLVAHPLFRRALLYGLHREAILKRQILRDRETPGCQVVSGPFPTGYAYNTEVQPRPYDPRLAMLLSNLALAEAKKGEKPAAAAADKREAPPAEPPAAVPAGNKGNKTVAKPVAPLPTLVIAHPANEVARLACRSIQRQLALLKMPTKLVELPAGNVADPAGDHDLVYAELQMWEPVTDARRLLGPRGLAASSSPYLQLALDELDEAGDWKEARDRLLDIHQLVADDVTIIPLWQLTESFAYRSGIEGIGERPATLYQSIEKWQTTPCLPAEDE